MDKQQLLLALSGLKGAPASIMLTLLLADEPLSRGDLELVTGYSGITIGRGLETLQARQYVLVASGGYALARGVQGFRASPAELHDSPVSCDPLSIHDPPDLPSDELIKKFFLSARSSSSKRQREILNDPEEEEEAAAARKILGLLARAGIGRRSKKAQEIAGMGLDVAYVEAHVKAWARAVERGEEYPASWLITKLIDGDPAPMPDGRHCPKCGERLHGESCLFCAGIIQR